METTNRPDIKLGDEVRDTISGFQGIVVCISNWLNGCQRITVQPQALHEGKSIGSETIDAEQVEVISETPPVKASKTGGPSIAPVRAADPKR